VAKTEIGDVKALLVVAAQKIHLPNAALRGGSAWRLPGTPACKVRQFFLAIIVDTLQVNLSFHSRKNLSENHLQFGHAP
jgi:hypothetical protein